MRFFQILLIASFSVLFLGDSSAQGQEDVPNYLRTFSASNNARNTDQSRHRLPDDVIPKYYVVELRPLDHTIDEYTGSVRVSIEATKPSITKFYLNGQNIIINQAYLLEDGQPLTSSFLDYCRTDSDLIQYQLIECAIDTSKKDALVQGVTYTLLIEFTARFWPDNRGLYKSHYTDLIGQKKLLLTTHFGQQARRLFPCWDEPKFKAQFEMIIHRDPIYHSNSISVANLVSSTEGANGFVDVYKPTAPISPYILAVVISDFRLRSDAPRGSHKFGVFARSNAWDQTVFAFEVGPKLIDAFDVWTNMSWYELDLVEKMEMAAIPDFSAGG